MVNHQVSLRNWTVEAEIPGDTMGYNITSDEISNKHVTRIQIQHVMRIRILHVNKIDLVQRRTTVNEDGGAELDIIVS